jgi:hypothetical protein
MLEAERELLLSRISLGLFSIVCRPADNRARCAGNFPAASPGFRCSCSITENEAKRMRSNLVYSAGLKIENRFLLATVVMRAVRKLHIDSTRTEDTTNRVFSEVAGGKYVSVQMPTVVAAPAIEPLLIAPAA